MPATGGCSVAGLIRTHLGLMQALCSTQNPPSAHLDFKQALKRGVAAVGQLQLVLQPTVPSGAGKGGVKLLAALVAERATGRVGPAEARVSACSRLRLLQSVEIGCGCCSRLRLVAVGCSRLWLAAAGGM